ncbi:dihydrofolate reductase [Agromyces flavus]|uniref:Dihydrofolate reductase n=1 Tax=Agromyces flavus TaxID=589382 RepID=A0A1H1WGB0_9MICO|nr:dihydrofolate reductase family protein [Agromyces flavus]MCP2366149.1 dihydrofolate reductase [Agromyces flavus]GGI44098.1 deaminase [Agromyces flavus]SDS95209.1 Dihydrofolate reductase [Agromyces flavus]
MAAITVFESVTLDGVMQAPGRPDEDPRGGFAHSGWALPYQDEVAGRFAAEGMSQGGALLFGHRTYDDLMGFWTSTPEPNPFTGALITADKFVATRRRDIRLDHPNSTALVGEAADTVAQLRAERDGGITVLGSGELVRALLAAHLVDELVLLQHPLVLGTGTTLFDATPLTLNLRRSIPTTTGVVIGQYAVR